MHIVITYSSDCSLVILEVKTYILGYFKYLKIILYNWTFLVYVRLLCDSVHCYIT